LIINQFCAKNLFVNSLKISPDEFPSLFERIRSYADLSKGVIADENALAKQILRDVKRLKLIYEDFARLNMYVSFTVKIFFVTLTLWYLAR